MNPPTLEITNVASGYDETYILTDVSLKVAPGEIYSLIGKNGAGKTTLLRTVLGLLSPTAGSVKMLGHDVTRWTPAQIVRLGVGYAPQEQAFFSDLSVAENLRLGSLQLSDAEYRRQRERMVHYFPIVGERLKQRAGSLSGGEQCMLKIARAILPSPRILLLDEISEGLQPSVVDRVRECLLSEYDRSSVSLILVEQNLDFISGFAHRFGLMARGRIVREGNFLDADAQDVIRRHLAI
jgi:ABC-type branched-subunit amino acid transport system ATPase component